MASLPGSLPYRRLEEQPALRRPPSYKVWSIFSSLCCCLPLGLVALHFSSQVEICLAQRNTAAAKNASKTARIINILALVCGLACIAVAIFIMIQRVKLIERLPTPPPTTYPPLYADLG